MDFLYGNTHLLHNVDTILEREYDTFLCRTDNMLLAVLVEVDSLNGTARFPVLQHTFGTVAKRQDADTGASDRRLGGKNIHVTVRNAFGSNGAFHPRVEDTRTVDAQKYAETGLFRRVIDVRKGIDTRFRVVVHLTVHTVNHPRSTRCGCYFTGVEYIQRQCVVGLVAGTVCDRRSLFQTQLLCGSGVYTALLGECRSDVGYQRGIETVIFHQEVCYPVVLEIPEHAFGQSGDCSADCTAQFHGNIIARQHNLVYLFIDSRFILLYPGKFGRGEVTRRVEQMREA